MIKFIILTTFISDALFAKVVSKSIEKSVAMEGILFIGLFGTLGVISYIYSSRHAKAYELKKSTVTEVVEEEPIEINRISELSEMLKSGILTKDEFELLNNHYLQN